MVIDSEKPYKNMVREAWKLMRMERNDARGFVKMVEDLVKERDRLREENEKLRRLVDWYV